MAQIAADEKIYSNRQKAYKTALRMVKKLKEKVLKTSEVKSMNAKVSERSGGGLWKGREDETNNLHLLRSARSLT